MRRLLTPLLLCLAMLATEQLGAAHVSSHAAQQLTQQAAPHDVGKVCEQCAVMATFASSPPAVAPLFIIPAAGSERVLAAPASLLIALSVSSYRSRAPPI